MISNRTFQERMVNPPEMEGGMMKVHGKEEILTGGLQQWTRKSRKKLQVKVDVQRTARV
jgi:hypothetical protein